MNLILMADGGSRGNPGPAACGFVILQHDSIQIDKSRLLEPIPSNSELILHKQGLYLNSTTNNIAEWSGLLNGLEWIKQNYNLADIRLQILMDSNLVIQQVQGNWKVKEPHLKPFAEQCKSMLTGFKTVACAHIYREYNKLADSLVNQVLDGMK